MHCQKYIYSKCTTINKVFLTYLIWTVMHTHYIHIYDHVCDNQHWQHILYLQQCRQVPHHKQFYVLQVVYPQMATNTTGKVNLGQEGKAIIVFYMFMLSLKRYENLLRNLCHTCHTELMESSSKFVLFMQMKKSIYPHLQAQKVNVKYYLNFVKKRKIS